MRWKEKCEQSVNSFISLFINEFFQLKSSPGPSGLSGEVTVFPFQLDETGTNFDAVAEYKIFRNVIESFFDAFNTCFKKIFASSFKTG